MRNQTGNGRENGVKTGRISDRPPWVVNLALLVRAAHQVGAAIFLAAYLLDAVPGPPTAYVLVALLSGGLLLAFEWWRHRQLFRELAGLISLVKILLLGAAFHAVLPAPETVLLAFVGASLGAHAPKKVRHRLLI